MLCRFGGRQSMCSGVAGSTQAAPPGKTLSVWMFRDALRRGPRSDGCIMTKTLCSRLQALRSFGPAGLALALFVGARFTSLAAPPANDNCAGAVVIPGTVSQASPFFGPVVSIADATSTGEATLNNSCQPVVSRGLWYRFTPVNAGFYTISTCAGATTVDDTVMAIYTSSGGCAGPFVQVACNDDLCGPSGLQAAITSSLLADT